MSLVRTLAKVAIGIAVAKGVGAMMNRRGGSGSASAGTGGGLGDLGGLLGGGSSSGTRGSGGTGLEGMMRDALGGGQATQGGGMGGLGGLIEGLGGGMGGLSKGSGGFGEKLNDAFARLDEPAAPPTPDEDDAAALMLKAMIQAAKADGQIDATEKEKLLANLGDVSAEERAFVNAELEAPVDVAGLTRAVPKGMQSQVYVMSVMAIDLDNQSEAKYLHELAQSLGIERADVNHIHQQLGVPVLYS